MTLTLVVMKVYFRKRVEKFNLVEFSLNGYISWKKENEPRREAVNEFKRHSFVMPSNVEQMIWTGDEMLRGVGLALSNAIFPKPAD